MSMGIPAPVSPRKRMRAVVRCVRAVRESRGGWEEEEEEAIWGAGLEEGRERWR